MKRFKRWLEGRAVGPLARIIGSAQLAAPPAQAAPMTPDNEMFFLCAEKVSLAPCGGRRPWRRIDMRVEALAGQREPTNWGILKRWSKSREVQLAVRIIFMLVVVLFAASVARAEVHAYTSASDCDADRDVKPKALYVAKYVDEWALIADTVSKYTFYSLGGNKCFKVTPEHRALLTGAMQIEGSRLTLSIIGTGAVVGMRVWSAAVAVANSVGIPLVMGTDPKTVAINLRNDRVAQRMRNPCEAIVRDMAGSVTGGHGGVIDYSKVYNDCIKKVPPSTGPANRVEIPRSTTPAQPAKTDLSTCDQTTLKLAKEHTHEGGIGEDWIENLAKQGKTCKEIESIVMGWIVALMEADVGPFGGAPPQWPGNWPPRRNPTPPGD